MTRASLIIKAPNDENLIWGKKPYSGYGNNKAGYKCCILCSRLHKIQHLLEIDKMTGKIIRHLIH